MDQPLPLFDLTELHRIRADRERLLMKLKRGGVDARTRIHREDELRKLTAQQILLETRLGLDEQRR